MMMPSVPTVPGEILSPSQASTFLQCSARYWFRYGLGLPDPAGGGAVRGKAVHSIVEYYMRAKMQGVLLEPAGLSDAWDCAWDQAADQGEFQQFDDIEQLKRSGAVLARKYLQEAAPSIEPAAVEVPFTGTIAGVPVRGIVDILDTQGRVIDLKTTSRKPSKISHDHQFQLATYTQCLPNASGEARIDSLVSTKDPQLVQIGHTPGENGRKMVEKLYPMVAEGINAGLFFPNRSAITCNRRHCSFADACEREFGGSVE